MDYLRDLHEATQFCAFPLTRLPQKIRVNEHKKEEGGVITDTTCVLCNLECNDALGLKDHIISHIGCISTMPVNLLANDDERSCSKQKKVPLINVANKAIDHNYSIKDKEVNTMDSKVNVSNLQVRHIKCWIDNPKVSKTCYYSCMLCGTKRFTFSNLSTHITKKCLLTELHLMESEEVDTDALEFSSKKPRREIVRLYNKSPKEKKCALLKCQKCDKRFIYLSALKLHMKSHQSTSRFLCITCGRSFLNRPNMLEHTKTHADEPAICTLCGVTYRNTIMLKAHMMSHTGTHPYQCDRCDEGFLFENDLKKHLKQEHDYVQRDFQCSTCKKMFTTTVRLSIHQSAYCKKMKECLPSKGLATSTNTRPALTRSSWLCSFCGKSFGSRTTMVVHEKSVHVSNTTSQIKQQKCTICTKVFPYRNQFRRHMMWHKGLEQVTCNICGWLCTPGASLRVHMVTHSDQRPFVCQCGSSFKCSSHLRTHKKSVHNIIVPALSAKPRHFSCYICGETFEGRKEQKQHSDLHHPPE